MKKKISCVILFIICIILMLSCFIGNPSNNIENRTMATFSMVLNPSEQSITYNESALERFEAAMKDQCILRNIFIRCYLMIDNILSRALINIKMFNHPAEQKQYQYTNIGNYIRIQDTDYICSPPQLEDLEEKNILNRIKQIEKIHEKNPEIKMYVYYVSQANDTNWFDNFLGVKVPDRYEQIKALLPAYIKSAALEYDDLTDYEHCHYASDHHWNHFGAQRGYEDIYEMMRGDLSLSKVKIPEREIEFSKLYNFYYRGSYAYTLGDVYNGYDDFAVFQYNLPICEQYVINDDTLKEKPVYELGQWQEYVNNEINKEKYFDHFINFYGVAKSKDNIFHDNDSLFIIKNKNPESNHNLIIFGESYNRALRDVLSSHFNMTVYMDYRMASKVAMDELIEKYNIDTLLISCGCDLWISDDYFFKFTKE